MPDSEQEMRSVDMDFHYRTSFDGTLPDAYERLLLEALEGDATLFNRSDAIEDVWRLVDPVIQGWEREFSRADGLSIGKLGAAGGRRTAGARWAALAPGLQR